MLRRIAGCAPLQPRSATSAFTVARVNFEFIMLRALGAMTKGALGVRMKCQSDMQGEKPNLVSKS